MKCYDCAVEGRAEDAVAICRSCGRATCLAHGTLQRLPQFRRSTGGIGGPLIRLPKDRAEWLCHDCAGVSEQEDSQ